MKGRSPRAHSGDTGLLVPSAPLLRPRAPARRRWDRLPIASLSLELPPENTTALVRNAAFRTIPVGGAGTNPGLRRHSTAAPCARLSVLFLRLCRAIRGPTLEKPGFKNRV